MSLCLAVPLYKKHCDTTIFLVGPLTLLEAAEAVHLLASLDWPISLAAILLRFKAAATVLSTGLVSCYLMPHSTAHQNSSASLTALTQQLPGSSSFQQCLLNFHLTIGTCQSDCVKQPIAMTLAASTSASPT